MQNRLAIFVVVLFASLFMTRSQSYGQNKGTVTIVQTAVSSPRVLFGIEKLSASLKAANYKVVVEKEKGPVKGKVIRVGDPIKGKGEGYLIKQENILTIRGVDASGVLYGCLELA